MVKAKNKRNTGQVSDGEQPRVAERPRKRGDSKADNALPDSRSATKRRKQASAHAGDKAASNKTARRRKPTSEHSKKTGQPVKAAKPDTVLSDIGTPQKQEPLLEP